MKIRSSLAYAALGLCVAAPAGWAQGGDEGSSDDEVLRKDIEILVDVSGSMHGKTALEAIEVVADLIRGQFRRTEARRDVHAHWVPFQGKAPRMLPYLLVENADLEFNFLEVDYFHRLFTGEGEVRPLAGEHNRINVTFFGDRMRTPEPKKNRFTYLLGDLHRMEKLTRVQEFRDQKTNLQLAMAEVRSRKGTKAGYYLFVISDGEDDPERADEDKLLLANWGPDNFSRDDHGIAILAHQGGGKVGKKTKPYICLVAAGFDPVKEVELARVVSPAEPKVKMEGAVTLLGGLASETPKLFRNEAPFLAWQVERGPDVDEPQGGYRFRVSLEDQNAPRVIRFAMNPEKQQGMTRISIDKETLFKDPRGKQRRVKDLSEGDWVFTIEEQNGRLKPASGVLVMTREQERVLPFAILAGVTSLLLMAYSWWAVRRRRMVARR